jgi:protein gp37
MTLAKRLKSMGQAKYQNDGDTRTSGPGFGLTLHPHALDIPRRWREPRLVFVNSMSDLFHDKVPVEFIHAVFEVMSDCPQHTFQLLTKRGRRLVDLAGNLPWRENVWMGVSVESDRYTFRADYLRGVPAAVRFVSVEPMLGPVPSLDVDGIDWVIAGGESGHGARSVEVDWVRMLRDRCIERHVAFFFKQWGGRTPKARGRELDGRHWDEVPTARVSN